MKHLNVVLATLATVFFLIAGGEAVYIVNVHRESAAWSQTVKADSVKMTAFSDKLASTAVELAARDSVITALRASKTAPVKAAARSKVLADAAKGIARDSAMADSVRHSAYEAAIASLDVQVIAQARVITTQELEIVELEEIRDALQEQLGDAIRRVVELQDIIAAAPAVQAPKKTSPFKVVGGFLAGAGAGILTVILLGAK